MNGEYNDGPPQQLSTKTGTTSLFRKDMWRTGGIGLKIHPDFKYANLYHWLLGDRVWMKGPMGCKLPQAELPYPKNAGEAARAPSS